MHNDLSLGVMHFNAWTPQQQQQQQQHTLHSNHGNF
jgi:preprotein translocase subunit YajC